MRPTVSALVLNYRNPQETVQCVEGLLRQTESKIEIIVIDNHSQDDSIGVLRNRLQPSPWPSPLKGRGEIRIIETPRNLGFGAGYNYGARYARGKYLLINNPAKILQPTAMEKMIQRMNADPSIGILAPKIIHPDSTPRLSTRAFPSPLDIIAKRTFLKNILKKRMARYLQTNRDPNQGYETDWVIGGCLMIRGDLFHRLGGFDERFFLFFEDIDLCRRVHTMQRRIVYDPSIMATDKKKRLSGEGFWDLLIHKSGRTHMASAVKYFRKWGVVP